MDMIKEVDPGNIKTVSLAAILNIMKGKMIEDDNEESLVERFVAFDKYSTGTVTPEDLKLIMMNFGDPMTDVEAEEMVKEAKPVDGKIDYRAFCKMIFDPKVLKDD